MIDRRELLWLCLASLAATACGVRRAPLDPDVLVLPARRHQADARLVGEAWLAAASPRPSADALAAELSEGAPRALDASAGHLLRRHRADLAAGVPSASRAGCCRAPRPCSTACWRRCRAEGDLSAVGSSSRSAVRRSQRLSVNAVRSAGSVLR